MTSSKNSARIGFCLRTIKTTVFKLTILVGITTSLLICMMIVELKLAVRIDKDDTNNQ
jgi:hypothetical protein